MLFCTEKFLYFFAVVFVAYWVLPWARARVWLLLVASYYFYASWNTDLARLIFLTTVCDFIIARAIDATDRPGLRRALLALSVCGNLGILCYFKYANFFLGSLRDALTAAGAHSSIPVLSVILPIGISFYTFEAISYAVDVYRRKIRAERNLDHFLLFILFFPHLVAGPIVRAADFLPQVRRPKVLTWPRIAVGGQLVVLGLFKKMVIADRMALLVDPVFADAGSYGTAALWMAAIAYAFQVYCDFSGYSDIALGLARLLGYRLAPNFNLPFLAVSISDLWRRWHISLSTWIRDYVYFPLGGNRGSVVRTAFVLIAAMALCGLWHGAAWRFVVWGALNGVLLVAHRWFRAWTKGQPGLRAGLDSGPGTALSIALTFLTFALVLVVFRAPDLHASSVYFSRMFTSAVGHGLPIPALNFWAAVAVMALGHLLAVMARRPRPVAWLPPAMPGVAYGGLLAVTLMFAPVTTKAFVYFQF